MRKLFCLLMISVNSVFGAEFYIEKVKTYDNSSDKSQKIYGYLVKSLENLSHNVSEEYDQGQHKLSGELFNANGVYIFNLRSKSPWKKSKVYTIKFDSIENLDIVVQKTIKTATKSIEKNNSIGEIKISVDEKVGLESEKPMAPLKYNKGRIEKENWFFNRRNAETITSFSFGPAGLGNLESEGIGYHLAYTQLWEAGPKSALKGQIESTFGIDEGFVGFFNASFGGNFFFNDSDVSPYLGIDMGFGGTNSKKTNSIAGFSGGISLGTIFFRTSNVQMGLEGRFSTVFKDNGEGYPSQYGLSLGMYF